MRPPAPSGHILAAVERREPGGAMGDAVWRYSVGVLFVAFKLDLCRALILESIYWNTTNTK